MGILTGYKRQDGTDIGMNLVEKTYLMDRYPELVNTFRFAGLWGWGAGDLGNLGNNSTSNQYSPVQTIAAGATWEHIDASESTVVSVKNDGRLWTWGTNTYGQLGDNTVVHKSSPVQTIAGGTNWKQVSAGRFHAAAIKTDGALWLWGENAYGRLGDNTATKKSSPVQTVSGGTNWRQVAAGYSHTAAIKTDGRLWLWGLNTGGQLGDNTVANKSSPVQTIAGGTNWKQVSAGTATAAIKTDGRLWTWGKNNSGQLGDNTIVDKSSPVQTIAGGTNWKQVSTSNNHMVAIKTDGTLWSWGVNNYGHLGDNTAANKSSPVQTIAGGTNWKQAGAGAYHTAAIKTDGTLWTWGYNTAGALGDGTTTHRSSPIQTVAGGNSWMSVSAGSSTFGIRDNSDDYI